MEAEAEKSGAAAILEKLEAKLLQLEADAAGEGDAAGSEADAINPINKKNNLNPPMVHQHSY